MTKKEFRNKCTRIKNQIILKSFPLLKQKKIYLIIINSNFYGHSICIPFLICFIAISKKSKIFNDFCLEGLLAHELSHQERYLKMTLFQYLKFIIKYLTNKKYRTKTEKEIDQTTVKKGYGNQLYELSIIQFKDNKRNKINKYYSSLEEIKEYKKEANI